MATGHPYRIELPSDAQGGSKGETTHGAHSRIAIGQNTPGTAARPDLYRGTMPVPDRPAQAPNVVIPKRTKDPLRGKISTFNLILLLLGAAAAIVLYISNIIAVDQLLNDVHKLQVQHQKILNDQEILKARINQMSSLERIQRRAEEELGLQTPRQAPLWLPVDAKKIEEVKHEMKKK